MTTTKNTQNTIHLQSIGNVPAIPAGELRIGDRIMWNFGIIYTVVSIENASAKFIRITERDVFGKEYTRRLRKDRMVAQR